MSDLAAFFSWYLAVTVCGALALPLAYTFFGRLPDRGYALARPLGLLGVGYVFWLLGSLGFLRNDVPGLVIAAALAAALDIYLLRRSGLAEMWRWLRAHLGLALKVEAVFLLAFALWAYVRAYNPDIAFTEKPMEYMFINSILHSPAFPPGDAWLSDHAISYYYFGYVLVAALTKITGAASAVGFNLGLALLFALTATGALGVALNLIALALKTRDDGRPRTDDHPPSSLLGRSFWPALLAPVMILLAGNLYGVLKIAHANHLFAEVQVPVVRYAFGVPRDPAARPASLADFAEPPGVQAGRLNLWTWLDLKQMTEPPSGPAPERWVWDPPDGWWWFSGARVTHDRNLIGEETEAITEMPAFSFLLGDMHPHVLALPFVFLAIALALNWMLWALSSPLPGEGGLRVRAILQSLTPDLLFSAIILGGLAFLNTWDFPIYLFVVVAALTVGLGVAWGWEPLLKHWKLPAALALTFAVLGVASYLPFYFTFQSQAGGLLPNLIYPTRFQQTVVMFGHSLLGALAFLGWVAIRARESVDWRAAAWAGGGVLAALILFVTALTIAVSANPDLAGYARDAVAPLTMNEAFGLMLQRRLVDSFTSFLPAIMIGVAAGLAVGAMRALPARNGSRAGDEADRSFLQSPSILMALVMLVTGALLLLGPEFVYLRDQFGTRMNTIFKFYFQTWVLWGLAGAFGLWAIAQRARPQVWVSVTAALGVAIIGGLVYTVAGVCSKAAPICSGEARQTAQPSLDGMAYFARQYPDDWAAIQWLEANAPGGAVIAEGIGGQYWIEGRFSRISMATGLPTVLGWPGHESQWRGDRYFNQYLSGREPDVRALYQTRDWPAANEILERYGIEYVIVSPLERDKYTDINQGVQLYQPKFDRYMRVAFQSGDVTIYQRLSGGQ